MFCDVCTLYAREPLCGTLSFFLNPHFMHWNMDNYITILEYYYTTILKYYYKIFLVFIYFVLTITGDISIAVVNQTSQIARKRKIHPHVIRKNALTRKFMLSTFSFWLVRHPCSASSKKFDQPSWIFTSYKAFRSFLKSARPIHSRGIVKKPLKRISKH